MPDDEFDMLGEEDFVLLSRRFERMYTNRKNARRSSGMCYQCGKHVHFITECPEAMEVKLEHKHRPRTDNKHRSRDDRGTTTRARKSPSGAKEEWWSQEEGAGDCRQCKQHRLKLLLLFIELK
jgi:hypothetical protein